MENIKNSFVYIDSFNKGSSHEMFNAGILACLNLIAENKFNAYVTKSQINSIKNIFTRNNIEVSNIKFNNLPAFPGKNRWSLLFTYYWSTLITIFVIIFINNSKRIIIPYNNVFSLKILNKISKLLKKRIIIFCHGELENLESKVNVKGKLSQLVYTKSRNFFLNKNDISNEIRFVTIGESTYKNLEKILNPALYAYFHYIDHPYFFKEIINPENIHNKKTIIGTIGVLSESKGFSDLLQIGKYIKDYKLNIELRHIGKNFCSIEECNKRNIILSSDNHELSRDEFDKKIEDLDYILFLYPIHSYKITASGAIMDAINFEKPILALKNDYFSYLFKRYGDFGYLFENIDELIKFLNKLNINPLRKQFDFQKIKEGFSFIKISRELENIINSLN